MTVAELCERWGCKEATIYCHIKEGRLDCIDVSRTGIDWSKRGPKQVAFTEAQVDDFERKQARTFAKKEGTEAASGPISMPMRSGLVRVPKRRRQTKA